MVKRYVRISVQSKFRLVIFAVYGAEKIITVCTDQDICQCIGVPKRHAGPVGELF